MAKKAAQFEDLWTSAREQIEASCAALGVDPHGDAQLYVHCSRVMGELAEARAVESGVSLVEDAETAKGAA